jgi:TIGR03009 family protein
MLKPLYLHRRQFLAGLAAGGLGLSIVADSPAQTAPKNAPKARPAAKSGATQVQATENEPAVNGKLPRPAAQPLVVEDVSPELEKILRNWELTTSKFNRMTGEFTRIKYEHTFEVESRAEGRFAYEAPDKGNYELRGLEPGKDKDGRPEQSQKLGSDGKTPYRLKADSPERWVCTGKEVIKINEKEKTYEKLTIPPESQGENIMDGPLPFLFGMKADQAKRRYKLSLNKSSTKTDIWLDVVPRLAKDSANWTKARVIIDAATFRPKAVKLVDPTGAESVHVFKNVEVNPKRFFWEGDPFKPNLRNLQLVLTEKPAAQALDENPIDPAATKPPKTAAAGNARTAPAGAPASAPDTTGRKKPASRN